MENSDYKNPYGLWKVTTAGDCEGRSTRLLGIHEGYLDDIAFALADKCSYNLTFTKINPKQLKMIPPKEKDVEVELDIDSGTWSMDESSRVAFFSQMLKNRDVCVKPGRYSSSVTLITNRKTQKERREEILAKLTEEEKAILGF